MIKIIIGKAFQATDVNETLVMKIRVFDGVVGQENRRHNDLTLSFLVVNNQFSGCFDVCFFYFVGF